MISVLSVPFVPSVPSINVLSPADAATCAGYNQNLVVSASQIMQQEFVSCVLGSCKVSLGHPWIWILRCASSSYQAAVPDLDVENVDPGDQDVDNGDHDDVEAII